MKTNEELKELKERVKNLNKKLADLNEEELAQVCGGLFTLDIESAKKGNAQVQLYEQNSTKAQKWVLKEDETGHVTMISQD